MKPHQPQEPERQLSLYLTGEHPCSYLDGLNARTLFVDPLATMDTSTYQSLMDHGFRRSGDHVYRPACRDCTRCIPVRIPVKDFSPNRSQRRNWARNAPDLRLVERPAAFDPDHFALYLRYLDSRHPDGSMADDRSAVSYQRFLVAPWGGETCFLEMRLDNRLVGVAVTDLLVHGLSAVYTFFDPDLSDRAPGTFAVLSQIEIAKRMGHPYLYLGYWIERSPKMAYKTRFRPIEAWNGHRWQRFERTQTLPSE